MTLRCGFYNSLSHDRQYNSVDISRLFNALIKDGIFMSIGDAFMVTPGTGMQVVVGTGLAWFNSTWTTNDAGIPIEIDPAEAVLNRLDCIALEINSNNEVRDNQIVVVKGTPASNPVPPDLTNDEYVHQYPLCYLAIAPGTTQIAIAMINNQIGQNSTPFVTGILETLDANFIVAQWTDYLVDWFSQQSSMFNEWFESLEDILDENTAGNLLNLINNHTHGNISHDGEIGIIANQIITTGTGGSLQASSPETVRALLNAYVKPIMRTNQTIPIASWASNSTYPDFPYRASLSVTNVISGMKPLVSFIPADAILGILCPNSRAYDGGIYIYASEIPSKIITIEDLIVFAGV